MGNNVARPIDPAWAWQRWRPSAAEPWDLRRVGHLFRRAGFGASLAEMQAALQDGPDRTIDRLVQDSADPAGDEVWASLARSIRDSNNGDQLSALWLYRMLYTPNALREKMTLFWHDHFATSNRKVRNAGYMLGQYDLMRRHALGSFKDLLQDMTSDPAMLVWLDNNLSTKQQPNENYARELMELFSLGITHPRRAGQRNYTENDIREAARAFTGWRVENGRGVFQQNLHDDTEKNVLGQRGRWQGRDVVRICLEQDAAPYFIAGKIYQFLVSETVPATPELLQPLADDLRQGDWNVGRLVERVLHSNLFFSPRVYRTKIKSPVEFALGIIRGLEGHRGEGHGRRVGTLELTQALENLGQRLFYPPSVAGWDGGQAWLNGQTFLLRQNLALALISTTDDRFGKQLDPAALARRHAIEGDEAQVDFFLRALLQGDVPGEARSRLITYLGGSIERPTPVYWGPTDARDHRVRALCHLVLSCPEFQLN